MSRQARSSDCTTNSTATPGSSAASPVRSLPRATPIPHRPAKAFPPAWFGRRDGKAYGVVLDAEGKIAWGREDIGGDPLVVVLTEQVADAHLAGLRSEGVSYFSQAERISI